MGTKGDPENKTLYSAPVKIAEFKSVGDDWWVEGIINHTNNLDLGRDVTRAGAFKKTLKAGPKVRFFRDHDPRLLLGVPLKLIEVDEGLFGRFKISKTKLGEETHELLQDGALDSFSMGYHADDYEIDQKENVRYLNEVTLYEASLVAMPMNPESVVTGFKDYLDLLGIDPKLSMADKARAYTEGMKQFMNDLRDLVNGIDHPLSEAKRKELEGLLEMFSGWDAVRSDLQKVLTLKPSGLVETHRLHTRLAELRQRYSDPTDKE